MPRPRRPRHDLDYLFVVTYGRSGSTLLMGLLNTLPGYLVRGENGDALHHLFLFHTGLVTESKRRSQTKSREPTHPFFGIADFPRRRSLAGIRRLVLDTVLRPGQDTRVTGFKEIRWYQPDLEDYVAWLRKVFPGARFLVNTRNLDDVVKSKWWAKNADSMARVTEIEQRILALAESLGDAAYRVHYDDYVADPSVLEGMFRWLGEKYDETTVRETMAIRHSV